MAQSISSSLSHVLAEWLGTSLSGDINCTVCETGCDAMGYIERQCNVI